MEFTKVYTSHYTLTGNSVIERTHSFLKASLRKIICNHYTDWDNIANIAAIAYNVFLHSSSGEAPFYLIFGWDAYMPTYFKILLTKIRYLGDKKCRIHLAAMTEIYMMTVLNLKIARDKCSHLINDPNKMDCKVADMVLLKNHIPTTAFD